MKKTKKMLSILLCILMTVGIFCSTPIIANAGNIAVEDSGASLAAIRFNNTTIKLGIGETYTFSQDFIKQVLSGKTTSSYGWSSNNSAIATVNNNGKITAKGVGETYISIIPNVSNSNSSIQMGYARCKVVVKKAPTYVTLSKSSLTLGVGETFSIYKTIPNDSYAEKFTWTSDNNAVATVEKTSMSNATITAKGTGTATIKVQLYNGKTATCKVTVKTAPKSVTINENINFLIEGQNATISYSTNSGSYSNRTNWSSSDSSIISVKKDKNNKATLTAKKEGTAEITVTTYNNIYTTCKIKVYKDNTEEFIVEVIRLVNIERAKEGVAPLERRSDLEKVSTIRAVEISECWGHTRPNGESFSSLVKEHGIKYKVIGENIAAGQETPKEVVAGWMNSPGHRENIMDPIFTGIGVGYYFDPTLEYEHFWVQN
ncbi:MAG: Ig-like domain-containing protein, partial [Ruminococcus sp.]|nr:Ig-like domain-containing protein [Ruminococcus sp.]